MLKFLSLRLAAIALAFTFAVLPAASHPHIWIDSQSKIVFSDRGTIITIEHEWTFDEGFSAWVVQGLDTNNDGQVSEDEMAELARENLLALADYDYYTFAGEGADAFTFAHLGQPRMWHENGRVTLAFQVEPMQRMVVEGRLEIEVADPEYYAALSFTDGGAQLDNAPEGCAVEVNPPKPISPELEQRLFQLGPEVTELPADLQAAAADLANALIITCGESAPAASAVEAIEQTAPRDARPFTAPPAETGLPVVRTGFLGWINQKQQEFYGALTRALGALKSDGNAFWVLGGLSFLYGVFHAAGPGHGKVVISSYMLATESEARRGILLSFVSSMMQAVTAVVFVLVAALLFNLTSSGLSAASGVIVTGSYVLVVALGLWLLARKLFGWGHAHHHHAHDHSHHDHDDDTHDHKHAVTPADTRGSWREMLGVVLAVGLRPCSGALVVLVFAISQGVVAAGIASVFLMGLGTAITVGGLALAAVGIKSMRKLAGDGPYAKLAGDVVWWLELFGALIILAFGLLLLFSSI